MPQLVQHAHLTDEERETLLEASRKTGTENVIRELRQALNADRAPVERAAESPTVPPHLATQGRDAARRRIAILKAIAPFLGENTAALLAANEQAEQFLNDTCVALETAERPF